MTAKSRVVFMYPDIAQPTVAKIEEGLVPRERLAGFYQLLKKGWPVSISDSRWQGPAATLRRRLLHKYQLPSLKTLPDWRNAELIIVKDDLTLGLTLLAKVMGKKIVYLDSIFQPPQKWWRRIAAKINLVLADAIITFSASQSALWAKHLDINPSVFSSTFFCIDTAFYSMGKYSPDQQTPYILAVGRDPGRDFSTLLSAIEGTGLRLKIVALEYLLPEEAKTHPQVDVLERLSYPELFALYQHCSAVVIPLKKNLTYPSGIRAALEALALGVPTICSRTPVLEEYFEDQRELMLVDPEDAPVLRAAIKQVISDSALRQRLIDSGRHKVHSQYDIQRYGSHLESILENVLNSSPIQHTTQTQTPHPTSSAVPPSTSSQLSSREQA